MKTSTPCPQCHELITMEDIEDFAGPFHMKCPNCRTKLKETRVRTWLLIFMIVLSPLFIYLTAVIQGFLGRFLPVIGQVPTFFIFLAFCGPLYIMYERFNALLLFNKGNIQIK